MPEQEYIALVVDEYGIVSGIITTDDNLETLLGFEIVYEKDIHPDMQKFALARW